jgi:hypothetical protein
VLSLTGNLLGADNDSGGYAVVTSGNSLDFRGTLHWHRNWCYRRVIVASRYGSSFIMFGISVCILGLLTSAPHLGRSAYRFAAITLAIVMLVPSTDSPRRIALHRFVEVCIGIGVALVLTVFWPEREEPHINTRGLTALRYPESCAVGPNQMHYSQASETVKKVSMPSQSQRTITGHDVEGEAIGSVTRQPVVKPKRWKMFLLTVAALYPLTLLIPEVLRITSHLIPALREGVVRGILAAALLVASVMFVIIPSCNRVFKKWLNS